MLLSKRHKYIKFALPNYFFVGVLMGLILSVLAGYIFSKKAYYHHFNRFFAAIGPEENYYPTPEELLITANHYSKKEQTLVLIGGSSIFRGCGQNKNTLWSDQLQKFLGKDFKVLNYANNGASIASFGGVAYRILFEKFPKIIFISTCDDNPGPIDGVSPYKYFFWDAYYKNLFHTNKKEKELINKLRANEMKTPDGFETHVSSFLESFLYFRNLWNWVNYHHFFTVWNNLAAPTPFKPKRKLDDIPLDFDQIVKATRADRKQFQNSVNVIQQICQTNTDPITKKYNESLCPLVEQGYNEIFSHRYRSKMLCVIVEFNPEHIHALPKSFQDINDTVHERTYTTLKKLGYRPVRYPSLLPDDYGDAAHLIASGGVKMAKKIADEVREIAKENHFVN